MNIEGNRYRNMILGCTALMIATATAFAGTAQRAEIRVNGAERYSTTSLELVVDGALPGGLVVISGTLVDQEGDTWSSRAVFYADARGQVDVAKAYSTAGTYTGVDADGLVWSMLPTTLGDQTLQANRRDVDPDLPDMPYPAAHFSYDIEFSAQFRINPRSSETTTLRRKQKLRLDDPSIVRTKIAEDDVHGVLYQPAGQGPFPTVVWLSGAGGGASEGPAALLASNGIAALALATHNYEERPDELNRIPLEYISSAIAFASRLHGQERVGLAGGSRGAEMSLLVASKIPDRIGAVAAVAPTNVGWGGCCSADTTVGYTLGGVDLPSAEIYEHPEAQQETVIHGKAPASMRERFLAGMLSGEPAIRVEDIQAPILLMAGDADPLWPAALAVELLTQRLQAHEFQPPLHTQIYQGAGHSIGTAYPFWAMRSVGTATPHPIDGVLVPKGGTPSANAFAARDGALRLIEFFQTYLRSVGPE